jgi:hypothetical protein
MKAIRTILTMMPVLMLLTFADPAAALESGSYSMEILVNGRPLDEYSARGTTYIEALEGREYSIRLRNRTGERIAVALSVDGLNSIDAKTTSARAASKWIVGPYDTVTISGWQTGPSTARRFFFTTEQESYGAWLGKTSNLGVISAAVFREKRVRPVRRVQGIREKKQCAEAPAAGARAEAEGFDLSDDMAATGIGREMGHQVREVEFRAESRPATLLELRYEYHDALVRLGVLPRPYRCCDDHLSRRERARGFEGMEFAPDPYN